MRIVVPPSMRADMLSQIHASHLGIVKCKQCAREALYWAGMSEQITNLVQDCHLCNTIQNRQHAEPLKPTNLPDLPWNELACDIFDFEQQQYIARVTIDYYSKFICDEERTPQQTTKTHGLVKDHLQ